MVIQLFQRKIGIKNILKIICKVNTVLCSTIVARVTKLSPEGFFIKTCRTISLILPQASTE